MVINKQELRYGGEDYKKYYSKSFEESKKAGQGKNIARISLSYAWDSVKAKINRILHNRKNDKTVNEKQLTQLNANIKILLASAVTEQAKHLNKEVLDTDINILNQAVEQTKLIIEQLKKANANKTELRKADAYLRHLMVALEAFKMKEPTAAEVAKEEPKSKDAGFVAAQETQKDSTLKNRKITETGKNLSEPESISKLNWQPSIPTLSPAPTEKSPVLNREVKHQPIHTKAPSSSNKGVFDGEVITPGVLKARKNAQKFEESEAAAPVQANMIVIPKETAKKLEFMNFEVPKELLKDLDQGETLTLTFTDPQIEAPLKKAIGIEKYESLFDKFGSQEFTLQSGDLPGQYVCSMPLQTEGQTLALTYVEEKPAEVVEKSHSKKVKTKQMSRSEEPKSTSKLKLFGLALLGAVTFTLSQIDVITKFAVLTDAIVTPKGPSTIPPSIAGFAALQNMPEKPAETPESIPVNTGSAEDVESAAIYATLGSLLGIAGVVFNAVVAADGVEKSEKLRNEMSAKKVVLKSLYNHLKINDNENVQKKIVHILTSVNVDIFGDIEDKIDQLNETQLKDLESKLIDYISSNDFIRDIKEEFIEGDEIPDLSSFKTIYENAVKAKISIFDFKKLSTKTPNIELIYNALDSFIENMFDDGLLVNIEKLKEKIRLVEGFTPRPLAGFPSTLQVLPDNQIFKSNKISYDHFTSRLFSLLQLIADQSLQPTQEVKKMAEIVLDKLNAVNRQLNENSENLGQDPSDKELKKQRKQFDIQIQRLNKLLFDNVGNLKINQEVVERFLNSQRYSSFDIEKSYPLFESVGELVSVLNKAVKNEINFSSLSDSDLVIGKRGIPNNDITEATQELYQYHNELIVASTPSWQNHQVTKKERVLYKIFATTINNEIESIEKNPEILTNPQTLEKLKREVVEKINALKAVNKSEKNIDNIFFKIGVRQNNLFPKFGSLSELVAKLNGESSDSVGFEVKRPASGEKSLESYLYEWSQFRQNYSNQYNSRQVSSLTEKRLDSVEELLDIIIQTAKKELTNLQQISGDKTEKETELRRKLQETKKLVDEKLINTNLNAKDKFAHTLLRKIGKIVTVDGATLPEFNSLDELNKTLAKGVAQIEFDAAQLKRHVRQEILGLIFEKSEAVRQNYEKDYPSDTIQKLDDKSFEQFEHRVIDYLVFLKNQNSENDTYKNLSLIYKKLVQDGITIRNFGLGLSNEIKKPLPSVISDNTIFLKDIQDNFAKLLPSILREGVTNPKLSTPPPRPTPISSSEEVEVRPAAPPTSGTEDSNVRLSAPEVEVKTAHKKPSESLVDLSSLSLEDRRLKLKKLERTLEKSITKPLYEYHDELLGQLKTSKSISQKVLLINFANAVKSEIGTKEFYVMFPDRNQTPELEKVQNQIYEQEIAKNLKTLKTFSSITDENTLQMLLLQIEISSYILFPTFGSLSDLIKKFPQIPSEQSSGVNVGSEGLEVKRSATPKKSETGKPDVGRSVPGLEVKGSDKVEVVNPKQKLLDEVVKPLNQYVQEIADILTNSVDESQKALMGIFYQTVVSELKSIGDSIHKDDPNFNPEAKKREIEENLKFLSPFSLTVGKNATLKLIKLGLKSDATVLPTFSSLSELVAKLKGEPFIQPSGGDLRREVKKTTTRNRAPAAVEEQAYFSIETRDLEATRMLNVALNEYRGRRDMFVLDQIKADREIVKAPYDAIAEQVYTEISGLDKFRANIESKDQNKFMQSFINMQAELREKLPENVRGAWDQLSKGLKDKIEGETDQRPQCWAACIIAYIDHWKLIFDIKDEPQSSSSSSSSNR